MQNQTYNNVHNDAVDDVYIEHKLYFVTNFNQLKSLDGNDVFTAFNASNTKSVRRTLVRVLLVLLTHIYIIIHALCYALYICARNESENARV